MKNIASKFALPIVATGLAIGTLLGGCSRKYVGNASTVKSAKYNEKSKYKESDLILNNNRYVLKDLGGNIAGIDFDDTQLNASTKTRLWDYDKDFSFEQTNDVISVGKFKQSRKIRKNTSKKIKEKDYKYDLKDHLESIKLGGEKYLSMKKGNKLFLFKQGGIDVVLDENTKEIYITNKQGQEGVYVATVPKTNNTSTLWSSQSPTSQNATYDLAFEEYKARKAKESTQEFHTATINPKDTLYEIAEKYNGVTVKDLIKLNPGIDPKKLIPGSRINIYIITPK